jgi:NSS family neurotransmitter:Na+ symporter
MNKKERGSFTGGIGFVLAAAGSAVGLGNLWRFPYLAAQYGGGIFILVYIILALTFGFTLMTTEIAIGRKTKLSPTRAYSEVNKKFGFIGPIAFIIPVIILPYYCVIGGWVTKYVTVFATGQNIAAADDSFFGSFVSQEWSLVFFIIFLGLTSLIVILGVEKGIEKVSKFLMPVLIVLAIVICIYVITIPGSSEGIKYYLLPDFSKFSFKTVCAAMGQMFYSMSLAMGIMITYGSYTRDDVSLVKSVNQIEIFDTGIALLAGMMVVPAVYIFSGEAGTQASGAGLMFVTLPKVFGQMTAGRIIGFLFFALVFFAALTSSVSVMEAITSMIMDRFGISRIKACVGIIIFSVLLGIPCSLGNGVWADVTILGMDFLTFCDFISNSLLLPVVAFLTCILIGWFANPEYVINEATKNGETFKRELIYRVMVKYIAPVLLLIILIFYTLAQFGVISY